ncbi:UPF0182 family protein [Plantibacter sp. PA-3-X8]|uniref:UPF0182 family membrane protein n=1 Tax=Plantibacter TaxID=190323 RepID=UPI000F5FC653|nr:MULTISPECIES: UPF0182 family protein [Plantibacter]MBD8102456.1 UPF0182 family protein [Plantibacter sp. CFBP 8775]AZH83416.1 UPF0182 family protein [Plantibacter sp. PA-3-X8]TKJ98589.1 hypothetical protein PlfCFBP13513_03850 [Plantibacter flavus]CAH0130159.1 hypothetical protein SRABI02_00277 [Plantibacter cousiniae]VXB97150.1 conserved membrane hypothetical protein [Plantibacter sp. T3]
MTSAAAEKPLSTQRRRAPIAITVAIIAALLIGFFVFSGFYADLLWFQQLGFTEVLTTQWIAAIAMFLVGFVGMALPVWLAIEIAYRTRPVYAKLSSQVDRYQQVVEPLRRLATYGIPALFGLFGGVAAASRWQLVLLWMNGTPSGTKDPQFNLDVSFYLFDLPFFQAVVAFSSAVVLIALIATAVVTYLYGGIRVVSREVWISMAARVQISVLAALYLILQAVSLWLDQYTTLNDTGTLITGASYTDVAATIPGRVILAGIALMVAVLFVVTAFTGRWRLPLVGTALLIVASLIVGSLYPWIVQRFQVEPNAKSLETPYIKRNIDMTRDAYGIADVEEEEYAATTDATPGALRQDAETTANIRIIDPSLVSASVAQLEQFKQFYSFDKQLDVDRYNIDGKTQDAVVAVRELNVAGLDNSQSWINNTVVYTHGYGLVAAYGNQRSASGEPVFLESGIPTTGALGDFEPRVYFGEQSPDYSIVGAPKGADPVELDYPSGTQGESQTYTTFDGDGGPKLDNVFKKLVYALKFQSEQIFLSDSVNSQSQILYDRDPLTRVQKVAPYLTLDSDPYPSVVDGQIVWIVDGYTTSASYPYSKTVSLSDTISDSVTPAQNYALDDVNYIRNSVKATVNAYDGKVTLYSWDDQDPILKTWQKVFPSTVKPMSDMSGDLMSHVRYPADLFKVQRSVLGQYHVTNAGSFYSSEDAWVTPNDPQSTDTEKKYQPPYYLTMQLPEQDAPSFSLYSTFIPRQGGEQSRNVLTGYLAVDANAGAEDGKRSSDYGKIRLLTLPKDDTVPGPGQVQNTFDSDPSVSSQINILKQGQTEVLNGNLLTVPVGGGLLYVQPVYVKSTGDTSFPLLQKVLVAFGDQIAFEDTLDEALDVLFGGDSGADAGDTNVPGDSTTPPTDGTDTGGGTDTGSTPSTGDPTVDAQIKTLLDQAKAAMVEKDAAMASGDWAAYGVADKKISDALAQALALLNG